MALLPAYLMETHSGGKQREQRKASKFRHLQKGEKDMKRIILFINLFLASLGVAGLVFLALAITGADLLRAGAWAFMAGLLAAAMNPLCSLSLMNKGRG